MDRRRASGSETWIRLREWTSGQAAAERLAAQILIVEGFLSVDPSHPLGGPDGLKDMLCLRNGKKWIGAAYFPRGKKSEAAIKKKFSVDVQGVKKNEAQGFAFITNQELSLGTRQELSSVVGNIAIELYHLERLSAILNSPPCYGTRLDFLDLEMTKEEQIAFMAGIREGLARVEETVSAKERHGSHYVNPRFTIAPLEEFEPRLHRCSYCMYGYFVNRSFGFVFGRLEGMTVTCPKCGNSEKWNSR